MIKSYNNIKPEIQNNVFIADTANVIGNVKIGLNSNIWFGVVIRADMHYINIGARTNVQDNSVIHVTTKIFPTKIGDGVTIGHGAIIHGCNIQNNCLIGMGAIVMDGVIIEEGSLIGAGTLIPPKMKVPKRSLVVGAPGKIIRNVTKEEYSMIIDRAQEYIDLASSYK